MVRPKRRRSWFVREQNGWTKGQRKMALHKLVDVDYTTCFAACPIEARSSEISDQLKNGHGSLIEHLRAWHTTFVPKQDSTICQPRCEEHVHVGTCETSKFPVFEKQIGTQAMACQGYPWPPMAPKNCHHYPFRYRRRMTSLYRVYLFPSSSYTPVSHPLAPCISPSRLLSTASQSHTPPRSLPSVPSARVARTPERCGPVPRPPRAPPAVSQVGLGQIRRGPRRGRRRFPWFFPMKHTMSVWRRVR